MFGLSGSVEGLRLGQKMYRVPKCDVGCGRKQGCYQMPWSLKAWG